MSNPIEDEATFLPGLGEEIVVLRARVVALAGLIVSMALGLTRDEMPEDERALLDHILGGLAP